MNKKINRIFQGLLLFVFLLSGIELLAQSNVLIIYNSVWGNSGTFNCVRNYAGSNGNFTLCPMSIGASVAAPACASSLSSYDIVMVQATYCSLNSAFISSIQTYLQSGGSVYFQNDCVSGPSSTELQQNINDLLTSVGILPITLSCNTSVIFNTTPIVTSACDFTSANVYYNSGGSLSGPGLSSAAFSFSASGSTFSAFWPTPYGGVIGIGTEFYSSGNWSPLCTVGSGELVWTMMNLSELDCGITASFSLSDTNICAGDCIDFTDLSVSPGHPITDWNYQISGGIPSSSFQQNPSGVCFNTPGTYGITLTVTNDLNTTDDTTVNIVVGQSVSPQWSLPSFPLCTSSIPIDLNALVTGTPGGVWSGSGVVGNQFDPSGGSQEIKYVVGIGDCIDSLSQTIPVSNNASTVENVWVCENESYTFPDGVTITALADTTYLSHLTTQSGCDSLITTWLFVNPAPIQLEEYVVCVNTIVVYSDGTSEQITENTVHTSILQTIEGCDSLVMTTVTTFDVLEFIDSIEICQGGSYTYPDGTVSTGILANELHVSHLTSQMGCDSTVIVQLIVQAASQVNAGEDLSICTGESLTLQASGALNYYWDNGVIDGVPFIQTQMDVTYIVLGMDTNDCTTTDEISVHLLPVPDPLFVTDVNTGCAPLLVSFTNLSTPPGTSCIWSFGDGAVANVCSDISHLYSTQGLYTPSLTITNAEGCSSTLELINYIQVIPAPEASFTTNILENSPNGITVHFINTSENADNYTWFFGNAGTSIEEQPVFSFQSSESGGYEIVLIAFNDFGCPDTAYLFVETDSGLLFYVPNSFTPNNDLFNDVFKPIFTSGFDSENYHFVIYNRWGEAIFETGDYEVGWDGRYRGEYVQDGTYVWTILFGEEGNGNMHEIKGHLTLIR